ncbi:hypothetical protein QBC47DRAFT_138860 [Echria macrotheca]|uniref:Transcription factor RfeG n=1 Tax=Echria macrotheca TaxID=438768 RepID=A0AAJ0FE53_9PEZI|nr:hypothetical protein QBC47DRAFT_138860 [Echria macrotheca]
MTGRPARGPPPAAPIPAQARQNEYFVPRDGIDREVITSDICRYLGNDALVRPGTYESQDGRVTQGYFITAYRNLTSAMIQDLKADSARWEQERRAAARTSGGGAGGAREQPRGSDYVSWKNRQLDSSSYSAPPGDRMDIEYSSPPNVVQQPYGSAPYAAAPAQGYPPAPYQPPVHGGAAPYAQPGPYGYSNQPPTQYSPGPPATADRYPAMAAPPPIAQVYPPQDAAFVHGSNYQAQGYPAPGPNRMTPMSMSSAPPSRAFNSTAGAPGYPEPDAFGGYGSAAGNPVNTMPFQMSGLPNPGDPVYGRAPGPGGTAPPRQGYSAGPEQQFDERQSPSLPSASTPTNGNPSQIPPGGPPPARRDADRGDRDRDPRDHRTRRAEPEDRHAADRARHRHSHR